ncbi:hypothetical protein GCM10009581_35220 [Tsukamurella strandjordii]
MHALPGETIVEQAQQIVGEVRPAVVLGHRPARRPAVTSGVVAQEAGSAQSAAEVEVEHPVAGPARREPVELDDGMSALVTEFGVEHGTGNVECGHLAFSQRAGDCGEG